MEVKCSWKVGQTEHKSSPQVVSRMVPSEDEAVWCELWSLLWKVRRVKQEFFLHTSKRAEKVVVELTHTQIESIFLN